jgi:hypothetical protein
VARAIGLGAFTLGLLVGSTALAQPVAVDCLRLEAEQVEELRARIRLALRSAASGARPAALRLSCDGDGGPVHLLWEGAFRERLPVDPSEGVIEGALDALERRLAEPPSRPPADAVVAPSPSPPAEPRAGGLGAGARFEPIAGPVYVGPRLDFGFPIGPLCLIALTSIRTAPKDTVLVGGELGIALGAPYRSDWNLGVAASIGIEALSAISSRGGPDSSRWANAPVASIGPRGALSVGRTSFWLGIDWRPRLSELSIGDPEVTLGRNSIGISAGILFGLDLTERKRR